MVIIFIALSNSIFSACTIFVMWPPPPPRCAAEAWSFLRTITFTLCVLMANYFGLLFVLLPCFDGICRDAHHTNTWIASAPPISTACQEMIRIDKEKVDEKFRNRSVIFSSHFKLDRLRILPVDRISFLATTTAATAHTYVNASTVFGLSPSAFTLLRFHYSIFYLRHNMGLNQKNARIVIYNVYLRWNIIFSVKYIQLIYWRATLSPTETERETLASSPTNRANIA